MWSAVCEADGTALGAAGTERSRLSCRRVVDSCRRWVCVIGDADADVLGFAAVEEAVVLVVVVVVAPHRRLLAMEVERGRIGRARRALLMLTDGIAVALAGEKGWSDGCGA